MKKNLVGRCQCRVALAMGGEKLVDRVEVHDLDARAVIDFAARHQLEELFGRAVGVRIAVGAGLSQQLPVSADEHHIDAPCVDADRVDGDAFGCGMAKSLADILEEE